MARLSLAAAALLLLAVISVDAARVKKISKKRHLISEVGAAANEHVSVPCDPKIVGSVAGCYNQGIKAVGNVDYAWGHPEIAYPTNGSPWGVHITPFPDGTTYRISWLSGAAQVSASTTAPDTSAMKATVKITTTAKGTSSLSAASKNNTCTGVKATIVSGDVITYVRPYGGNFANYSYVSPFISHVMVKGLSPRTTYYFTVGDGSKWSQELAFTTLTNSASTKKYPLRVGLLGDVGQTVNSTATRDHIMLSSPDVVLMTGDFTYADNYGPNDAFGGSGTNQGRWDSWFQLWSSFLQSTPVLGLAGNHEIEGYYSASTPAPAGYGVTINYTTNTFSYPSNYPFQSYAARWPAPGVQGNWGDITQSMYYATTIGGVARVIVINNYMPFHPGTPQYNFVKRELESVDRTATPWLFVMFHTPVYHTYYVHYKEAECFRGIYEPLFYAAGVDMIFNGHVHAYERTHPMYDYEVDTCGPIWVTIGDGGNVEGPYRNFVDEIEPNSGKTFCELLTLGSAAQGRDPNTQWSVDPSGWGPGYQRQAHKPGCNTMSWESASGIKGGAPLVLLNTTDNLNNDMPVGFCQSSQPVWSAHRDPSFGHGVLNLLSATSAEYSWYRNIDGNMVVADKVVLSRQDGCTNKGGKPAARK